jgi:8-oxo-dGTP pyrophosphatase MutT (NUDIX family)
MSWQPVAAEDAATVLLVREGEAGLEVYLTRRQESLVFLGGYTVFPGGKVDAGDRSAEQLERCRGLSAAAAAERLPGTDGPERAVGFFVAGFRELFEETGVLVAEDGQGCSLEEPDPERARRLAAARIEVQDDRLGFPALLRGEDLYLPLERLFWFARWITPATSPRRFNTYFFLARLPAGQSPSPFSSEIAEAVWSRPEEALERWRRGQWRMIPPTIASLDTLSRYRTWAEARACFSRPEHPRTTWP